MVTTQGHGSLPGGPATKITKARSKVVKPILKKLTYSEKGSLDLDRGWEDQQPQVHGIGVWEPEISTPRSAKDVSFSFGTAGAKGGSGGRSALSGKEVVGGISSTSSHGGGGNVVRKTYQQHGRSHSGNSVATNGSGVSGSGSVGHGHGLRSGSFVHPFQQMPRTSTPPLSYANSLASFDNSTTVAARDYSPTITENEDGDGDGDYLRDGSLRPQLHLTSNSSSNNNINSTLNLNHHHHHSHHPSLQSTHSSTFSQTGLRRPSFASQRTSSLTDITSALTSSTTPQQLRVNTNGRSTPTTSRLAPSRSNLDLSLTLTDLESQVSKPTLISAVTAPAAILGSPITTTSSSTTTPMSPLRTSLEAMGRLRSRSEVDSASRQEQIRQARRKFEEREKAKAAKYEREEVERRNRQANKEASRIEKEQKEWYKTTGVSASGVGGVGGGSLNGSSVNLSMSLHGESVLPRVPAPALTKGSSSSSGHPSASRRTSPTRLATSSSASVPTYPMGRSVGAVVFGGAAGNNKKHKRKGSSGLSGTTPGGGSSWRPDIYPVTGGNASNGGSSSRKNSGLHTGKERQANLDDVEKGIASYASNYDSLPQDASQMPQFGASIDDATHPGYDWRRDRPRRSSDVKKKTQTFFQGFVLWLRTRIFKLKRKAER